MRLVVSARQRYLYRDVVRMGRDLPFVRAIRSSSAVVLIAIIKANSLYVGVRT